MERRSPKHELSSKRLARIGDRFENKYSYACNNSGELPRDLLKSNNQNKEKKDEIVKISNFKSNSPYHQSTRHY